MKAILGAFKAALWARRHGYSIIHTFLNDVSVLLPWPMKILGVRVVISRRDEGFWYTASILRALRFNRSAIDLVVANSKAVAEKVVELEYFKPQKLIVLPNGVRAPRLLNRFEARRNLEIGESAIAIACIANLRPLKRVGDAIRAVARLRNELPELQLLVAGSDRIGLEGPSHLFELQQMADMADVSDRVRFLGHVEDVNQLVQACDIGILCSETEGMSNAVLQFMIAGRPVVASAAGGNVEIVSHERTGLLYPVGDIDGLTDSIRKLASRKTLRSSLGQAAKADVTTRFAMDTALEQLVRAYEKILPRATR
jgi:glycosyltransferase involved in cell wall biosynthesis